MTSFQCPGCGDPIADDATVQILWDGAVWHNSCRDRYCHRQHQAARMAQGMSAPDPASWAKVSTAAGAKPVEFDPTGKAPNTPGAKLDAGKAPMLRGCLEYFPLALEQVAKVSEYGATKYTWKGWETVPGGIDRYGDALVRHLVKAEHDPDTGLLHAAHAAWNALARLELMLRERDKP